MSLVSAADTLKALKFLEHTIKWVKCPWCQDEVTKLRPCTFWIDRRNVISYVCVECAETKKGFQYLRQQYPIPGIEITEDKHKRAVISYGSWSFIATRRGAQVTVVETGKASDHEKIYENNFQVWFALKNTFEKPDLSVSQNIPKGKWR